MVVPLTEVQALWPECLEFISNQSPPIFGNHDCRAELLCPNAWNKSFDKDTLSPRTITQRAWQIWVEEVASEVISKFFQKKKF